MLKPKKVVLKDGRVTWEIYGREGGRGSKEIRKRFPSYKDAADFLDNFSTEKKELHQGVVSVGSFYDTNFKNESENWLLNLKPRSSPGHYLRMQTAIEDFNKTYGDLEPNKITIEFLTKLQGKLKERPGKKESSLLANSSVNKYTEAVCAVLSYSASQRRIPSNPLAGFKKLPRNSPEMLFWDEEEAGSFLAWASLKYCDESGTDKRRARKNYIAYLMALNTGARAGEIWGLKPHDLIFSSEGEGDTLFIRRQLNRVSGELAPLKGGVNSDNIKSRHVPCAKELKEELETLVQSTQNRGDKTVFQNDLGNPVNHDSFSSKFERDQKAWGGRQIRFHDLRHTAATLMLSQGIDVKTVSEILGHEDLKTTLIYVHLLGNRIKQVSKSFSVRPVESNRTLYLVK